MQCKERVEVNNHPVRFKDRCDTNNIFSPVISKMTSRKLDALSLCSADSDYVCVIWFLGHQRFCKQNINAKFKHNLNSDLRLFHQGFHHSAITISPKLGPPPPPAHANLFRMTEWDFQFLSAAIKVTVYY